MMREQSKKACSFFFYDPGLYKKALLRNELNDDWERTGIFLCNYLRANENPILIRVPIKEEILSNLQRNGEEEFESIIKHLGECDVSSNLFD